ncbi:MAG: hypothetical protein ABR586_09680 [Thermoplasmatota archaeon]
MAHSFDGNRNPDQVVNDDIGTFQSTGGNWSPPPGGPMRPLSPETVLTIAITLILLATAFCVAAFASILATTWPGVPMWIWGVSIPTGIGLLVGLFLLVGWSRSHPGRLGRILRWPFRLLRDLVRGMQHRARSRRVRRLLRRHPRLLPPAADHLRSFLDGVQGRLGYHFMAYSLTPTRPEATAVHPAPEANTAGAAAMEGRLAIETISALGTDEALAAAASSGFDHAGALLGKQPEAAPKATRGKAAAPQEGQSLAMHPPAAPVNQQAPAPTPVGHAVTASTPSSTTTPPAFLLAPAPPASADAEPPFVGVTVTVSGKPEGLGILYGQENRQGTRHSVPIYRVAVTNGVRPFEYHVTRDTADDHAAEGDRTPAERRGKHTTNHEAPPGTYVGTFFFSDHLQESVLLLSDEEGGQSIAVDGQANPRTSIYIHRGPGMSKGCLLGQMDRQGQAAFMAILRQAIAEDEALGGTGRIRVILEPRP